VEWAVGQITSDADVLETVVPEPDDDAVRILTVHGSKGLEFPITIVAGLATTVTRSANVLWGADKPEIRFKAQLLESAGYPQQNGTEGELDDAESLRLLYVAMTRAKDHLILGCYHKPRLGKGSQPERQSPLERLPHAERLWRLLGNSPGLATVEPGPARGASAVAVPRSNWPQHVDRNEFRATRAALLEAIQARVATTATALVEEASLSIPARGSASSRPRPHIGAAVGTAVHWVLEHVTLTGASAEEIHELAAVACATVEIPTLVDTITAQVQIALTNNVVRDAALSGRFWREVYVVSRDGERYIEGYIDLLVEDEDGELLIVDYKTSRQRSTLGDANPEARYGPQLAVYEEAISRATGRIPRESVLVFTAHPPTH
jgi:ATP-dependent helicase/nuclease subunit A